MLEPDINDLASVGDNIGDVDIEARRERPGHQIFMHRVGKILPLPDFGIETMPEYL